MTSDDPFDPEMRVRITELATTMAAGPGDVPSLGHIRDDAQPSCWRDGDGHWHLTIRERGTVLADRHTDDPDEFLSWVAVSVAETMSYRLCPPGDDFGNRVLREQFRILSAVDQRWADDLRSRTHLPPD